MNLKRAKALRQALREFAQAQFKGKAPNNAYSREPYNGRKDPKFWGGMIRLIPREPRAVYLKAKRTDFLKRHPKETIRA